MKNQTNFNLQNNVLIPKIGFGVWQNTDFDECVNSVYLAIKHGFRLIDTAAIYGNEEAVGIAIQKAIDDKLVTRQELFITTKVWLDQYDNSYDSIKVSLQKLKLEYLDLILLHQPYANIFNAWQGLEKAYNEKLVRSIGVSNFHPDVYENLAHFAKIKPMVNQIEVNPYHQRWYEVEYFQNSKVQVEAWSPLATGKNDIFNNPTLLKIAQKHNTSVANVICKWLIDRNIIPLVKSTNENHIKEYGHVFEIQLDENDYQEIKNIDNKQSVYFDHRDPEIVKFLLNHSSK